MSSLTPHRIIVVRLSALGDVVLTTPLLRALRHAFPDARITMVTSEAYEALFTASPHVSDVVTAGPADSPQRLVEKLSTTSEDVIMDLQGNRHTRRLRRRAPGRWSVLRKRRAHRRRLIWTPSRFAPAAPAAETYFRAANHLGVMPDGRPAEIHPPPEGVRAARAIVSAPYVVLAPGASRATKRWPARHWVRLTRLLADCGWTVVGVGLAREALPRGTTLVSTFGGSLGTAVALCANAGVVVANDSGLMHVAGAVGTPVVALFGPTIPEFGFHPYRASATVLQRDLACRPCAAFGASTCPAGHHRCLADITPEHVAAAVTALVA